MDLKVFQFLVSVRSRSGIESKSRFPRQNNPEAPKSSRRSWSDPDLVSLPGKVNNRIIQHIIIIGGHTLIFEFEIGVS